MSINRLTCTWPSAAAHARRNSISVSGPRVANVSSPPGLRTRRHSRRTASGSLHHCNIRLLNTMSTLAFRNGSAEASAQTRAKRRSSVCRRRASFSMPSARSSATTRLERVAPFQGERGMASAGSKVEHGDRLEPHEVESPEQFLAHFRLQHGSSVVRTGRPAEGAAHARGVDDERVAHATWPCGWRDRNPQTSVRT